MKKFIIIATALLFFTAFGYRANGSEPQQIVIEEVSPESLDVTAAAVASIQGPTEVAVGVDYVYDATSELGFHSWSGGGGVSIKNIQNSGYYHSTATITFQKVGTFRIGYGDASLSVTAIRMPVEF
ncbi:MAG: hypothetical protein LIO85_08950 [Rikenellaceae bacterium]|nr:hypothetical protein [Rikenellaceae bacterium]